MPLSPPAWTIVRVRKGGASCWGQKVRTAFGVDLNLAGSPETNRKSERTTVNQVTNAAPVVRRQIEQWQLVSCVAAPAASYRTCPQ
jgi:hypothetical protein